MWLCPLQMIDESFSLCICVRACVHVCECVRARVHASSCPHLPTTPSASAHPQAAPPRTMEGTARRRTEQEVWSGELCLCACIWLHWRQHHQGGDTGDGSQGTGLQRNRSLIRL